jgi:hypothetical protein
VYFDGAHAFGVIQHIPRLTHALHEEMVERVLPPTIDPYPASCVFSLSGYNSTTDKCGSGTHISQLTQVDLSNGYWAYANSTGAKLMPIDVGEPGGDPVSSDSEPDILATCYAKDTCSAIAISLGATSSMKSTECQSPCFQPNASSYMAYNDKSPLPFNPYREVHAALTVEAWIRPLNTNFKDPDTAILQGQTVRHAISQMLWLGVACLPIRNDSGELIGQVHLTDLVQAHDQPR